MSTFSMVEFIKGSFLIEAGQIVQNCLYVATCDIPSIFCNAPRVYEKPLNTARHDPKPFPWNYSHIFFLTPDSFYFT